MPDVERCLSVLDRVVELAVLREKVMTEFLDTEGLTPARAQLVRVVAAHGAVQQSRLAELLGVTARNVTALVDALVATGFAVRRPHPGDRRAVLVELSTGGAQVAAAVQARHAELAAEFFAELTDRRLDQIAGGLAQAVDRLRARTSTD